MRQLSTLLLISATAATALTGAVAGTAQAAGTVQVSFVKPERFADIGFATRNRADTLQALEKHLQALGAAQLADGQTLKIDVLDVDLAGREKPMGSRGDIRVLNGRVDWPRIKLHYVLEAGGRVVSRGDESLTDMNYLDHLSIRNSSEPLRYEKAMLDTWFKTRFGDAVTTSAAP